MRLLVRTLSYKENVVLAEILVVKRKSTRLICLVIQFKYAGCSIYYLTVHIPSVTRQYSSIIIIIIIHHVASSSTK